jgi:hypothetical protein
MDDVIRYFVEILTQYGNQPQMREYLDFFGLTHQDIEDFKQRKSVEQAA